MIDNINSDKSDVYGQAPIHEPDRQYYFINKCKEMLLEKKAGAKRQLTYCVTTFGCQMNAHDSEKLKGILDEIGYEEVDCENADLVIFNTCTVRENANKKLYGHLGNFKKLKKENPDMKLCLCGCMMQEAHVIENIKKNYKYVDIVFGTHNIYKLAELIYMQEKEKGQLIEILDESRAVVEALPTKRKFAFKSGVNIMYGCNNFCTYCIVPYVRGRERSRRPEDIYNEIKMLAKSGIKEIMLLGQNVNSYGKCYDNSENASAKEASDEAVDFPDLLSEICKIDGIERIRFMTSHPKDLSDKLIDVMAKEDKICKHLHLPVQAGSTDILSKMNRCYTKEQYLDLVSRIRAKMPDIALTTDIMIGFPGETEEDFLDTLDVVEKVRFDQAFTFIYSRRTGTPAATMDNQIDETTLKKRFNRLLNKVNEIANERTKRFSGQIKEVLVEEVNHQDDKLLTGRTMENVTVHFEGEKKLIGSTVKVLLKEPKGFYFIGERVGENE